MKPIDCSIHLVVGRCASCLIVLVADVREFCVHLLPDVQLARLGGLGGIASGIRVTLGGDASKIVASHSSEESERKKEDVLLALISFEIWLGIAFQILVNVHEHPERDRQDCQRNYRGNALPQNFPQDLTIAATDAGGWRSFEILGPGTRVTRGRMGHSVPLGSGRSRGGSLITTKACV